MADEKEWWLRLFYAGMDAYVDWVREVIPDGSGDSGYPGPETARRLFDKWIEENS